VADLANSTPAMTELTIVAKTKQQAFN